jgi:hypothetical protein
VGIAERFPRAVGNEGNLVLVFLVSTAWHFHSAPPVSYALTSLPEAEEELPLGGLHSPGGFGVAVRVGDPL